MLEKIAKLDSLVLRGLAVALIGLIGKILSLAGVDEMLFSAKANEIVDAALTVLTTAGVLYAAYARINHPNPPLSDAAVAVRIHRPDPFARLVRIALAPSRNGWCGRQHEHGRHRNSGKLHRSLLHRRHLASWSRENAN